METPSILIEREENLKNDSYTCTLCSSKIEILSIKNNNIKFKCLNNDIKNNHGLKIMPLKEYLEDMVKNTYLFSKCSICGEKQNSSFKNLYPNFYRKT